MSEPVRTDLSDGILTVTLARPEKKNAITQAMYSALAEAANRARTDDAVRVLLFKGEGDSFSAGNDIADFIAIGTSGGGQVTEAPVFQFLRSMADLDKPAVAAVRGRAVGIGLTLLLNCDLVVVAEDALLSVPFVNLALAPEAASSMLLPMAIGHQRAFEMFAWVRRSTASRPWPGAWPTAPCPLPTWTPRPMRWRSRSQPARRVRSGRPNG